ncbi:nucleotide sugar dehydrogenase [Parabacteroides sp. Marseille-P3160]|uniref:nucleotide sugar dehydrogenase n=1 Tax=Parabacteroides sp. Marseille-P3160 TaxID=1917887 RepID=UPI0009BA34B2|nr:nucleotide sugar dehydrogenase [Parabacteroides sp. Marseille-P3160]
MKIGIIGLGYVGLPLAVAFSEKYRVMGYDLNTERIRELKDGIDCTKETEPERLLRPQKTNALILTNRTEDLRDCTVFIVTVPTPITRFKTPDLGPLLSASDMVGKLLKKGDTVIYESTVYPGCTEEDCVPVLEKASGLVYNTDFFCGYSPERINPGDKKHTLATIKKVVSGSTPEIAEKIDALYRSVITAGTYKASSIKVAEASKAIENAQRDVNISFMNELALIFDRMDIDTHEVLEAAATKWNFLPFSPGLVGGHCIGVDPYYLLHKSQCLGYNPQVILSGRTVNNEMGRFVAQKTVKLMIRRGIKVVDSRVLILGLTFKENCPDTRNTKVVDVIDELKDFGIKVDVYDPYALREEVREEYGITLLETLPDVKQYDAIILTVAHDAFKKIDFSFTLTRPTVLFDVKSVLDKSLVDGRL